MNNFSEFIESLKELELSNKEITEEIKKAIRILKGTDDDLNNYPVERTNGGSNEPTNKP